MVSRSTNYLVEGAEMYCERGIGIKAATHDDLQFPFFIRQCRSDEARSAFRYQSPEDFVLGVAIGSIVTFLRQLSRSRMVDTSTNMKLRKLTK